MADIALIAQRLKMVREAHERFLGLAALDCIMDGAGCVSLKPLPEALDAQRKYPHDRDISMLHWSGVMDDE